MRLHVEEEALEDTVSDCKDDGNDDGGHGDTELFNTSGVFLSFKPHEHSDLEGCLDQGLEGQLRDSSHSSEAGDLQLLHFEEELV